MEVKSPTVDFELSSITPLEAPLCPLDDTVELTLAPKAGKEV